MGVVYKFAQSEGLLPLGEQFNLVSYVSGIPSVSDYEAIALTPEQTLKVLEQLQQPEIVCHDAPSPWATTEGLASRNPVCG